MEQHPPRTRLDRNARQLLLGYYLGALEPGEVESVEARLAESSEWRDELERVAARLAPLRAAREHFEPPRGLARRTCDHIFFLADALADDAAKGIDAADALPDAPCSFSADAAPRGVLGELTDREWPWQETRRYCDERAADNAPGADPGLPPAPVALPAGSKAPGGRDTPPAATRARWADVLALAALAALVAAVLLPLLAHSQFESRLARCQSNLRQVGLALASYNQLHGGCFPPVPTQGKTAAAGIYASLLRECDLLVDTAALRCPAAPALATGVELAPRRARVEAAEGEELVVLRRFMGGSYAYNLGFFQDGVHQPVRNLRRPHYPILADAPRASWEGDASPVGDGASPPEFARDGATRDASPGDFSPHGGRRHNVLFEDFSVREVLGSALPARDDDFFRNRLGLVAAGVDVEDAVLGPSAARPLGW